MAVSHNRKGRRKSGPSFLRLYHKVKRSQAYHELSVYARAALVELLDRFDGSNNGMIVLGVRQLAEELRCGHTAASKALRDLDDAGLARPTAVGAWRGKRATEWRLMFYRCDRTGDVPQLNFAPRLSPSPGTQSPSPGTQDRSQSVSRNTKAKKPNKRVSPESVSRNTSISTP